MGQFAVVLSNQQLHGITTRLIESLSAGMQKQEQIMQVETIGYIVNAVQNRFASFVPQVLPILREKML
jgi:hypothetical protein